MLPDKISLIKERLAQYCFPSPAISITAKLLKPLGCESSAGDVGCAAQPLTCVHVVPLLLCGSGSASLTHL